MHAYVHEHVWWLGGGSEMWVHGGELKDALLVPDLLFSLVSDHLLMGFNNHSGTEVHYVAEVQGRAKRQYRVV